MQHEYVIEPIVVNGTTVSQVIIDDHYKENHGVYMTDDLILKLVIQLNGRKELPEDVVGKFSYFATLVELEEKD